MNDELLYLPETPERQAYYENLAYMYFLQYELGLDITKCKSLSELSPAPVLSGDVLII